MLTWVKSLFGKGKVRVEFEGIDQNGKMVKGSGKIPYVGEYDEEELLCYFKKELVFNTGVVATRCWVVAHIQD